MNAAAAGYGSDRSGTRRVLVVEDDASVRALVQGVLAEEGLEVVCARHGAEALAFLEEREPHLILLDLAMPVMDGPTFAREYARRTPHPAPIILLSASSAFEAASRTDQLKAAGFLVKPFDVDHLVEVVGRALVSPPQAAGVAGGAAPASADLAPRAIQAAGHPATSGPKPDRKPAQPEDDRRRQLRRLAATVNALREGLARIVDETRRYHELERTRKLTDEEQTRVRTLRMDSERTRYELQLAWREFERLRRGTEPG